MIDSFGRKIDYLRISVTDRCNFRCIYCMPKDGVEFIDHKNILTFDEIIRLCKIFKKLGIERIRLTGGEPLVRKGVEDLIKSIHDDVGITNTPITTNGFFLKEKARNLYDVGVRDFNISLDAISEEKIVEITRCQESVKVFDGIDEVLKLRSEKGDVNIKFNVVPSTINADEFAKLVDFAIDKNITIRFIELMPIGFGKGFKVIRENEIIHIIENTLAKKYGKLSLIDNLDEREKCRYYKFNGIETKIGFISSLSHKFCDRCNRIRLTSTGFLKTCLQYSLGVDLKKILNRDDDYILLEIKNAIINKPKGHHFNQMMFDEKEKEFDENKKMSDIGG